MTKSRYLLCGLIALFVVAGSMLRAQTEPTTQPKPAATAEDSSERAKPRGRLPNNYGKLGVSEEQRDRIYELQAQYNEQIDELLMRIEELRSERDAAVENELTDGQRARLEELRAEAAERRTKPRSEN